MPKTIEELTKDFETLTGSVSTMKKDFELKLEGAKRDAAEYKSIAEKAQEDLKTFKVDAEKAQKEKEKAFAELRANENKNFLEGLKKVGKITPALQEIASKLMESLTSEAVVHTFEGKDGKKTSHTQLSLFKELLNGFSTAPILRNMSQTPAGVREIPGEQAGEKTFVKVLTGGGVQSYELDGADLDSAANQYIQDQKSLGRTVSYADALIAAERLMKQAA